MSFYSSLIAPERDCVDASGFVRGFRIVPDLVSRWIRTGDEFVETSTGRRNCDWAAMGASRRSSA